MQAEILERTHVRDAIAALRGSDLPDERVDLKSFDHEELEAVVIEGLGEKKYRAKQLFQWLYLHRVLRFEDMTNLSRALRERLAERARISPLEPVDSHRSADGTTKLTFRLDDDSVIESVYIPSDGRNTLCISSQVGCAMGCTFCWTAKMGLFRNLSCAEIVDQVVLSNHLMAEVNGPVTNIVFMGMGEPLHNYDNVVRAVSLLTDDRGLNFSRRKVTISTSGLVPAIEKLGEDTDVNLAISLNATTDETRSSIMPVNDRWNIATLMDTLREYPIDKRQRIMFEYVLIKDINDTLEDAERLRKLVQGIPAKINLIPFNPHPRTPMQTPDEETMEAFQQYLMDRNVFTFRRVTRGQEEMAACGQLGKPGERKEPKHLRMRLERLREQLQPSA